MPIISHFNGVGNVLRVEGFLGTCVGDGDGIVLTDVVSCPFCISTSRPVSSILHGVDRRHHGLDLIHSRSNRIIKVLAVRSVLRRLINRVCSRSSVKNTSGSWRVFYHCGYVACQYRHLFLYRQGNVFYNGFNSSWGPGRGYKLAFAPRHGWYFEWL